MNVTGNSGLSCAEAVPRAPFKEELGVVYFATCKQPDYPIKIGWTMSMASRLHALQAGLPYDVVVLVEIPGTPDFERQMHVAFHASHIRGEWFRRDPELMEFIHLNRMPKGML